MYSCSGMKLLIQCGRFVEGSWVLGASWGQLSFLIDVGICKGSLNSGVARQGWSVFNVGFAEDPWVPGANQRQYVGSAEALLTLKSRLQVASPDMKFLENGGWGLEECSVGKMEFCWHVSVKLPWITRNAAARGTLGLGVGGADALKSIKLLKFVQHKYAL